MISYLVAMDRNNVIGQNNDIPWHLPDDLKYFKELTVGNPTIMGRKTYESIGKPLPNRPNIVITRDKNAEYPEEVEVIHDVETVKKWNEGNPDTEYFVIGGGVIFSEMMPFVDRMYITLIEEEFEGDTYFPEFSLDDWEVTSKRKGIKDEKNPYDYYYIVYDRKK